jgi:hypothetical protein
MKRSAVKKRKRSETPNLPTLAQARPSKVALAFSFKTRYNRIKKGIKSGRCNTPALHNGRIVEVGDKLYNKGQHRPTFEIIEIGETDEDPCVVKWIGGLFADKGQIDRWTIRNLKFMVREGVLIHKDKSDTTPPQPKPNIPATPDAVAFYAPKVRAEHRPSPKPPQRQQATRVEQGKRDPSLSIADALADVDRAADAGEIKDSKSARIRLLYKRGFSRAEIAKAIGCSYQMVFQATR